MCVCVCVCACVRACDNIMSNVFALYKILRACVRACVRVCVRACMYVVWPNERGRDWIVCLLYSLLHKYCVVKLYYRDLQKVFIGISNIWFSYVSDSNSRLVMTTNR